MGFAVMLLGLFLVVYPMPLDNPNLVQWTQWLGWALMLAGMMIPEKKDE